MSEIETEAVSVINAAVSNKALEDVVLYLLEAKSAQVCSSSPVQAIGGRQTGSCEMVSMALDMPWEGPQNTNVIFGDRLYTDSHSMLLSGALDIIGDEYESMIEQDYGAVWKRYRVMKKAPKNRWAAGKVARWYSIEVANILSNGQVKEAFTACSAFSSEGYEVPSAMRGFAARRNMKDRASMVIEASMREDCARPNSIKVSLHDSVTANFVVDMGAHLDLLDQREGFMVKNRRKALVHKVCRHARQSARGVVRPVAEYLRGEKTAIVGGVFVTLTPQMRAE